MNAVEGAFSRAAEAEDKIASASALPLRWGASVFHLSRRVRWNRLPAACGPAAWPGRYFLCRHCYGLGEASQSEGARDRTLRRANKIRQRLEGDPGMAAPFPTKPRGMWMRTYKPLREEAFDAEMRVDVAFSLQAERLLGRIDAKRKRSFRGSAK